MSDWLESVKSTSAGTAAMLAAAALAIAALLPKLLNNMKATQFDSDLLERLGKMDKKIHKTSVKVTRLAIVVTELNALLIINGVAVPQRLKDEIAHLLSDPKDPDEEEAEE